MKEVLKVGRNDSKAQEQKKKNNTTIKAGQGNPKLSGPDRPST